MSEQAKDQSGETRSPIADCDKEHRVRNFGSVAELRIDPEVVIRNHSRQLPLTGLHDDPTVG